jgi:hypothetical protein
MASRWLHMNECYGRKTLPPELNFLGSPEASHSISPCSPYHMRRAHVVLMLAGTSALSSPMPQARPTGLPLYLVTLRFEPLHLLIGESVDGNSLVLRSLLQLGDIGLDLIVYAAHALCFRWTSQDSVLKSRN